MGCLTLKPDFTTIGRQRFIISAASNECTGLKFSLSETTSGDYLRIACCPPTAIRSSLVAHSCGNSASRGAFRFLSASYKGAEPC
jgi:hypothetical protein